TLCKFCQTGKTVSLKAGSLRRPTAKTVVRRGRWILRKLLDTNALTESLGIASETFTGGPAHVCKFHISSPLISSAACFSFSSVRGNFVWLGSLSGRPDGVTAAKLAAPRFGAAGVQSSATRRPAIGPAIDFSDPELRRSGPIRFQEASTGGRAARNRCR